VNFMKHVPIPIKKKVQSNNEKLKVTKRSDGHFQYLVTKRLIFMSPEGLSLTLYELTIINCFLFFSVLQGVDHFL